VHECAFAHPRIESRERD